MIRTCTALVALGIAALFAGCGPSVQPLRVSSPFTAEHAPFFENGVDYIEDPSILEGSWLEAWEHDIEQRVSLSDAIALVTITTLRTDQDLERHETWRLVAHVDRVRHGEGVPEEITLVVREGEAGFGTVRGNEERLLNQRFVLFVKWSTDDSGVIVPRWHLSPAGERIVRRVNSLIELRHTPVEERRRVIVHEHDDPSDEE